MENIISSKRFKFLFTFFIITYALLFTASIIIWHEPLPFHRIVLLLGAASGLLKYYYDTEEEKIRFIKRIPYVVVGLIALYFAVKFYQKNYSFPRAKAIMEEYRDK